MALCTRSRLSHTLASGNPTMVIEGNPPSETSTSTLTGNASTPKIAVVRRMANTGCYPCKHSAAAEVGEPRRTDPRWAKCASRGYSGDRRNRHPLGH